MQLGPRRETAVPLIDFLRDTGKHFTVNYMLAKDSVKSRMETGISFTEFTYMLVQAYDFWHLWTTERCELQMGGSDQWGNITAGTELIARKEGAAAHGLVLPLITTTNGEKFGKSVDGAVYLDPQKTSPYRFYQFWLNTDDREVVNYLKYFTFLGQERVAELAASVEAAPEQRQAQRVLASQMTGLLHGETALARAEQASAVLFGAEIGGLTAADIAEVFADVPSSDLPKDQLQGSGGLAVVDLLVASGLAKSKGEARRAIAEGGIYLNNHRVADEKQCAGMGEVIDGQFMVLRKGRKNYHLVKVI